MIESEQSEFNAGIAKLKRIDMLKSRLHLSRESNDMNTWFSCLCGWREEMSDRMNEEQERSCDCLEHSVKSLLNTKYSDELKDILKRYGIYLSKLERKFGLGMPDKDLASRALK